MPAFETLTRTAPAWLEARAATDSVARLGVRDEWYSASAAWAL